MKVVHAQQPPKTVEVEGYTMPLKDVLGMGASVERRREDMDAFLKLKAAQLKKIIFGEGNNVPLWEDVEGRISDGTIVDFRSPRVKDERNRGNLFGELGYYLEDLAYHIYVKRDVLELACEHQVIISTSPFAKEAGYPMETLIVKKEDGRQRAEQFIESLAQYMDVVYGVKTQHPSDIKTASRKYVWNAIDSPLDHLRDKSSFDANIELQKPPNISEPPTLEDIKKIRAWFNKWYCSSPARQEMIKQLSMETEYTIETQLPTLMVPIDAVIRNNPKADIDRLKSDTI
ncbi:MAG: hypothetical protein KKD39_06895 [Candidatus Altiarchaeota archaeon]|nr:hypothetical protein [Candidatus Altiarchaeota archaeon]